MLSFPYKYTWGFSHPDPNLLKFPVDFRAPKAPIPKSIASSSITRPAPPPWPTSKESSNKTESDAEQSFSGFPKMENVPPGSSRANQWTHFGEERKPGNQYFGGPIFNKVQMRWRETFYTRASGSIVGSENLSSQLPPSLPIILQSVAAIHSRQMCQSALWISPRLLLSTLHLYDWKGPTPTIEELEYLRYTQMPFDVESEITSKIVCDQSPKVKLIAYNVACDIGLFKLLDEYPSNPTHVNLDWLLDRDAASKIESAARSKVACIGFSSQIAEQDSWRINMALAFQLHLKLPEISNILFDFETLTKPQLKSFCPGTWDLAQPQGNHMLYGVSATLWKGSSGGPCIILEGPEAGRIIGLVRGYEAIEDPYNLVNGFPANLKEAIISETSS